MNQYKIVIEDPVDEPMDVEFLRDAIEIDRGGHIEARPGRTVVAVSVNVSQAYAVANCLADQGIVGQRGMGGLASALVLSPPSTKNDS